MKAIELKRIISECCNAVTFTYQGKPCGIEAEVYDSVPIYHTWYGDETSEYANVDDVMKDQFFGGKSLAELIEIVELNFS